ncbi:hypothetical protein NDR87_34210 [Nocardia sp. CDC159]|uniref:DUF6545 domain-containing protein n=1 Tax=Nocardia pulmonis TaxID=2951408 RepID=A0A9X2EDR3_9NOCA|nr:MULTISPECIES: MAB_1171c family putative transporter [Nocardia]MCM6778549.1 hypothetical protein [Nocardia pulmonis]MCM6791438.1 hypothetical protein [Nocardia sp. CDC159]
MDSTAAFFYTAAVVSVFALAYKVNQLRRDRSLQRWTVLVAMSLWTAVCLCVPPPSVRLINRITGIPNITGLIVYILLIFLAGSMQAVILVWQRGPAEIGPKIRVRAIGYAAIGLLLIALFFAGNPVEERPVDFDIYYAKSPWLAELIVIYNVVFAVAAADFVYCALSSARVTDRPWLRRGLYLVAVSGLLGVISTVTRMSAVVARWFDVTDLDRLDTEIGPAIAALGIVVACVGYTLPAAGERCTDLIARLREYHALRPLWRAIRTAAPGLSSPIDAPWWDLKLRTTRRLAEIRDGQLALRAYTHPTAEDHARRLAEQAGLDDIDRAAVVEAAGIKAAVQARLGNLPARPAPPRSPSRGGSDSAGEIAWLTRVSNAYANSPIVAETLRALRAPQESRR